MGVYTPNVTIQGTNGGSAVTVKNAKSATFDTEFTVTDNGNRNARIDIASGGGGTISGTIAEDQVAFGSGTNAIEGSSDLTWNGSKFMLDGAAAREIEIKDTGGTSVSTVLLQVGSQGENAVIEMGSETGAFLDMKDPYSADYNLRLQHTDGLSKILSNATLEITNVGGGGDDDIKIISKRNTYLRTDGTNIIEDEVADTSVGPVVELRKMHQGAAYSGSIRWMAKNDGGSYKNHLNIFTQFSDDTASSEDTKTYFRVLGDGGDRDAIQIRADSALPYVGINCHPAYTLDIKTNSENAGLRINTNEAEADYLLLGAKDIEMYNIAAGGANSKFRIRNDETQGITIMSPSGDWINWMNSSANVMMRFTGGKVSVNAMQESIDFDVQGAGVADLFKVYVDDDKIGIGGAVDADVSRFQIKGTDNSKYAMKIVSTDNDADSGPVFAFERQNADGVAGGHDELGEIRFRGLRYDSGSDSWAQKTWSRIVSAVEHVQGDGSLKFFATRNNGEEVEFLKITGTSEMVLVNPDAGNVVDFQVNSDSGWRFRVDAAANRIKNRQKITALTDDTTLSEEVYGDVVTMYNASSKTVTLPAAAEGMNLSIVNYGGGGTTIISADGTDTINGSTLNVTLGTAFTIAKLYATESNKWILNTGDVPS